MKERPILFSAPMVRAILDGRKTQTRRALSTQPLDVLPMEGDAHGKSWVGLTTRDPAPRGTVFRCKFGVREDRLWVRETWAQPSTLDPGPTFYRADYPACVPAGFENVPPAEAITWKPSIHMPRALSRILLEVTGVRVERLQDISEADAIAEGCIDAMSAATVAARRNPLSVPDVVGVDGKVHSNAVAAYRALWEQINGAGSWDANPWVWVIEFRMCSPVSSFSASQQQNQGAEHAYP